MLRVARRRRAERFYACGALEPFRAARSTRTLGGTVRLSEIVPTAATAWFLACTNSGVAGARPEIVTPLCDDPAPISNSYDPKASGYLVIFHVGTDARQESSRLAQVHGFTPRHVFAAESLQGFSAELSPAALAALRCDKSVNYVEFNLSTSIAEGRAT